MPTPLPGAGGTTGSTMKLKGKVNPPYVYYLLPGNESSLMRECFDRRPWWKPVEYQPGTPNPKTGGVPAGRGLTRST